MVSSGAAIASFHICEDDSAAKAIKHHLARNPQDWSELSWTCLGCGRTNPGAREHCSRDCQDWRTGRNFALHDTLTRIGMELALMMDNTTTNPELLSIKLLMEIILSPHNRKSSGLLDGAFVTPTEPSDQACICVDMLGFDLATQTLQHQHDMALELESSAPTLTPPVPALATEPLQAIMDDTVKGEDMDIQEKESPDKQALHPVTPSQPELLSRTNGVIMDIDEDQITTNFPLPVATIDPFPIAPKVTNTQAKSIIFRSTDIRYRHSNSMSQATHPSMATAITTTVTGEHGSWAEEVEMEEQIALLSSQLSEINTAQASPASLPSLPIVTVTSTNTDTGSTRTSTATTNSAQMQIPHTSDHSFPPLPIVHLTSTERRSLLTRPRLNQMSARRALLPPPTSTTLTPNAHRPRHTLPPGTRIPAFTTRRTVRPPLTPTSTLAPTTPRHTLLTSTHIPPLMQSFRAATTTTISPRSTEPANTRATSTSTTMSQSSSRMQAFLSSPAGATKPNTPHQFSYSVTQHSAPSSRLWWCWSQTCGRANPGNTIFCGFCGASRSARTSPSKRNHGE